MSDELSEGLQRLDTFLSRFELDDDTMVPSELDGFLAGIVVSPQRVEPDEWMPVVWGDGDPPFESAEQAKDICDTIMGLHDDIVRQLDKGAYDPLFDVDTDGTLIWELWAAGFHKAMRLCPDAWFDLRDKGDEAGYAMFMLGRMGFLATARPGEIDAIDLDNTLEEHAGDLIPGLVQVLHKAGKTRPPIRARQEFARVAKVGRNDPCPCGSGKKYKKCCLR